MLLSSQSDFKYDDQTSSSDPPGPPPEGDGSSGIWNMFSGAFGFGGGRSSNNQESSRNDSERWYQATRGRNERSRSDPKPLSRDDLRDFALGTLRALDDGEYFPPGAVEPYELTTKIRWSEENTRYYGPDAGEDGEMLASEFAKINQAGGDEGKDQKEEEDKPSRSLDETKQGEDGSEKSATTAENKQIDDKLNSKSQTAPIPPVPQNSVTPDTPIYIGEYSTLVGARKVHFGLAPNLDQSDNKKIGVLNFASAKKPGGGFINGSQAQEESIARASTLYPSLITPAASEFYKLYQEDPNNAYYTHAMVYSPAVLLLRDDSGQWRRPVEVDVLTSAAVNAGEIRRGLVKEDRERREREEWEIWKRRGEERRREGEERRREVEKAMAERERLRKEKQALKKEKEKEKQENEELKQEKEKLKQEKEEVASLKKEKAELTELQKGMTDTGDEDETKKTVENDLGSEKEETSIEKEKGKEKEELEETETETESSEEDREEKATDNPEGGNSADSVKQVEDTEPTGASIQADQPQPEAAPEFNQEPTSSTTILHPLSSQTEPSQAPKSGVSLTVALSNAESQIQLTMYHRISRILHLFQLHQTPHLILGSFGTGVFQNHIDVVASIFADLLVRPGGRFKNVFKTVVFAILGKETVRGFENVFSRVEKEAQRERGGKGRSCLFLDNNGSDGDVREGEEEKRMRKRRWRERRAILAEFAQAEANAASVAAAQADEAAYLAAHAAYLAAHGAAHAEFNAGHTGAAEADQAGAAGAGDGKIAEDEMMILTNDNEKVELAVEEGTANAMVVDDGNNFEMSYHEAQLKGSDVEMDGSDATS